MVGTADIAEPAARQMIEAINAEDTEAFLATFTQDGVVDDWGRRFTGREEIAGWNDRELIGLHSRVQVTGVRRSDEDVVLDIQVTGEGYNGGGTFTLTTRDGAIRSLTIRG